MSRVTLPKNAGRGDDAPRVVFSVLIAAGQAVSDVIQSHGATLVGVIVPAGWTSANIQFETSVDGANWYTVKTSTGETAQVSGINGAGAYALPVGALLQGSLVRLVSADGVGSPVVQVSEADLQVVAVQ